ncbi:YybH family protein [Paenibacillus guangzhouensis]|uniref:YybH family protein n=1 Tax=Paenibacillus guangzhouensis TaxID=1473112 RepID=UPI001266F871|nr:DUF4440 domain-containing protein [Paenibacillus guangzhouensis]
MNDLFHPSPVLRPEDMNAAFANAYNSGDINHLLALYEPDGVLINPSGAQDRDEAARRDTLTDLLRLQGTMVSKNIYCVPFENIALLRAHFTLTTVDAEGKPLQISGHTSEIVRQQADGSWLYIVDHPTGAGSLGDVNT